jgi:hypothetical protein
MPPGVDPVVDTRSTADEGNSVLHVPPAPAMLLVSTAPASREVYYYSAAVATGAHRPDFSAAGTSSANAGDDAARCHTGNPTKPERRLLREIRNRCPTLFQPPQTRSGVPHAAA